MARVHAAREAIDASGADVLLTGRAETFLVADPDLEEAIRRLTAYAEAGADCLYAPGLSTLAQVEAVVKAVSPRPVNVLMARPGFTRTELAGVGVRRISVGSGFARIALGAFMDAARGLLEDGRFESAGASFAELDGIFGAPEPR